MDGGNEPYGCRLNAAEVGIAGEQNYLAAGGLNATEVNE